MGDAHRTCSCGTRGGRSHPRRSCSCPSCSVLLFHVRSILAADSMSPPTRNRNYTPAISCAVHDPRTDSTRSSSLTASSACLRWSERRDHEPSELAMRSSSPALTRSAWLATVHHSRGSTSELRSAAVPSTCPKRQHPGRDIESCGALHLGKALQLRRPAVRSAPGRRAGWPRLAPACRSRWPRRRRGPAAAELPSVMKLLATLAAFAAPSAGIRVRALLPQMSLARRVLTCRGQAARRADVARMPSFSDR